MQRKLWLELRVRASGERPAGGQGRSCGLVHRWWWRVWILPQFWWDVPLSVLFTAASPGPWTGPWHIDSRVVCLFFPNPHVDLSISDQNYNRILWGTWTANLKFLWGFPRQSVVKTPPFHCRSVGLIPGWGSTCLWNGTPPKKNFFMWMCKGLRIVKTLLKNQDVKPLLYFKIIIRQCDQLRISETD